MNHFQYRGKELYCEDVAVKEIAAQVGTPFYVYSHATLTRHMQAFASAFSSVPHLICYSIKANSNLAVLKTFVNLGAGFDIVSVGNFSGLNRFNAIRKKLSIPAWVKKKRKSKPLLRPES
jgi:diaminopimelate decarboxylase